MNREEAKQLLPIIQAFADGEAIQWRRCTQGCWLETSHVDFPDFGLNHGAHCYRIKPKPILRPWTSSECPQCFIVKNKRDPDESRIAVKQHGYDHVRFCSNHGETSVPIEFDHLAREWERVLEDGTRVPCGVIVTE